MQIAVIGANGGIGHELLPRLVDAGYDPVGIVRDPDQFSTIRSLGGEPRLGDLEEKFKAALEGVDGVVFTAGSGGDTGWDKTILVDLWGARRSIDACLEFGITRYVMISAFHASEPLSEPTSLRPYWVAKRCADDFLISAPLAETILRPTTLTDEPETGRIATAFEYRDGDRASISRADVAQTVIAVLDHDETIGETIRLFGGESPIEQAILPEY